MSDVEVLRKIVSRIGGVEASQIGPDFPLEKSALKGSLKRAALAAAIRRDLGVTCPAAHTVKTFAELEQAVNGGATAAVAAAPALEAAPARVVPTMPTAPRFVSGGPDLRCGFDIEMISELPEADDYREHEFYVDSFSPEEIAYCVLQENPRMHFAARWCAKEALHKCDPAFRSEKMANVDVARKESGEVFLRHRVNGSVVTLPHAVSLSHTNQFAAAIVVQAPGVATGDGGIDHVAMNGNGDDAVAAHKTSREESPWAGLSTFGWLFALAVAILALIHSYK